MTNNLNSPNQTQYYKHTIIMMPCTTFTDCARPKNMAIIIIQDNVQTSCDGVDKAAINCPTIGFTLGFSLSKCLAKDPIKMTILCRTAS